MTTGRRIGLGIAVAALALGIAAYEGWYAPLRFRVDIGEGLLAKQICSCVFVAGRDLADCRADQFASMDRIQVGVEHAPDAVRAFVPLFGERVATYRAGLGCTLQ